jgi:hypothetical protein
MKRATLLLALLTVGCGNVDVAPLSAKTDGGGDGAPAVGAQGGGGGGAAGQGGQAAAGTGGAAGGGGSSSAGTSGAGGGAGAAAGPTVVHGCPPWLAVNPFTGARDYVLVSADHPAPAGLTMCDGCSSALCDDGGKRYVGCDNGGESFDLEPRVDFMSCGAKTSGGRAITCVASCAP